jgi:AraC-like DNA-binding protein
MQVQNLYQPFEIEFKKENICPIRTHKHTFFELVYMLEGKGIFHINENKFNYHPDNLFLMVPNDSNYCEIESTTSFLFIRFNNIYLKGQETKDEHNQLGDWIKKMEFILHNSNPVHGCIIRNQQDKPLVRAVVEAIVQEYLNKQTLHKELIQQLINTLITLVARNISLHIFDHKSDNSAALGIIHYIHQNIYNPGKLKAESIADHFNISQNYISEYFKKHFNENLGQYIINYKLSLVETRLMHSNMRVNEIALELGFTDESHLTRTFKKYRGVSPTEFKKGLLAKAS